MKTLIVKDARKQLNIFLLLAATVLLAAPTATAQEESLPIKSRKVYDQIKAAALTGGSAQANGLVLKRDRVEMTFTGVFYFTAPVEGRVTGAVFIGTGSFNAVVPPSEFEKENVKRLLGTDSIESNFKTAVLRFTDDTFEVIGQGRSEGAAANADAQKLINGLDGRILKETGANLPARVALSLLNGEQPGFFFANFDGGRRDRFSFVLDHQSRIPVANFGINGGEKGLIFAHQGELYGNDVWTAFYDQKDYQRNAAEYADVHDLVDITHYRMNVDVLDPKSKLKLVTRISMQVRQPNLRAIFFQIGEGLVEDRDERIKKQMRLQSIKSGGVDLVAIQEDWEGGLTVFLPSAASVGQKLELDFELEGDFMWGLDFIPDCFYPKGTDSWYPRHGYLDRSTFDFTFRHRKNRRIATIGVRLSEEPDPEDKENLITKYSMPHPVALVTFAIGPFERHRDMVKWEGGGEPIPVEYNSLSSGRLEIKEDFVLAELSNAVRYFTLMFGKYPYPVFGGAFHPRPFGQGFPTLLMMPWADSANKRDFSFIAHETAHQWWGNIVAWRSYRDQWLSEGFAEYSGALYTGERDSPGRRDELISEMREIIRLPPETKSGIGKGRLNDVGPLILGHRLTTSKTYGAYQVLIYSKGALVLRMLHFLFTNPSNGDGKAFFTMMTDFVERHRNGMASTEEFRAVANEHFARTPIAQKYRLKDLNWFFNQWVYQTGLPSYRLEYQIQEQAGGAVVLSGNVFQENVPENWFMPLPLLLTFGEKQFAGGTIHALGAKTPFEIKLPAKPKKVELDPYHWVLTEKTSTKGK